MTAGLTVVVDYGLCNIDSMARALEECGARDVQATRDPRLVAKADRIVLPASAASRRRCAISRPGNWSSRSAPPLPAAVCPSSALASACS
jgi:hypothetical protein